IVVRAYRYSGARPAGLPQASTSTRTARAARSRHVSVAGKPEPGSLRTGLYPAHATMPAMTPRRGKESCFIFGFSIPQAAIHFAVGHALAPSSTNSARGD